MVLRLVGDLPVFLDFDLMGETNELSTCSCTLFSSVIVANVSLFSSAYVMLAGYYALFDSLKSLYCSL